MAKSATKKKVRRTKRQVRDLGVKAAAGVKGGRLICATGEHIKEATITVR